MFGRFSIANLLLGIGVFSLVCMVIRQAFFQQQWALAIAFVLASITIWMAIHLVLVGFGYLLMLVRRSISPQKPQSPFATDTPAPQIIPPRNVDSD